MARRSGLPGYRYAVSQHPFNGNSQAEFKEKAAGVIDDIVAILAGAPE